MATIKDIAALAQVSSTTVSRVLSQDDTMVVSPEVRTKILNIARELNYVPPRMRHTQANKKMIIGIADWQIVRKDRPNVRISSLNKIAATISSSVESEFERMQKDLYKIYDGVIAFGIFSDEEMEQLKAQSRAIVFINSDEKDYRHLPAAPIHADPGLCRGFCPKPFFVGRAYLAGYLSGTGRTHSGCYFANHLRQGNGFRQENDSQRRAPCLGGERSSGMGCRIDAGSRRYRPID